MIGARSVRPSSEEPSTRSQLQNKPVLPDFTPFTPSSSNFLETVASRRSVEIFFSAADRPDGPLRRFEAVIPACISRKSSKVMGDMQQPRLSLDEGHHEATGSRELSVWDTIRAAPDGSSPECEWGLVRLTPLDVNGLPIVCTTADRELPTGNPQGAPLIVLVPGAPNLRWIWTTNRICSNRAEQRQSGKQQRT